MLWASPFLRRPKHRKKAIFPGFWGGVQPKKIDSTPTKWAQQTSYKKGIHNSTYSNYFTPVKPGYFRPFIMQPHVTPIKKKRSARGPSYTNTSSQELVIPQPPHVDHVISISILKPATQTAWCSNEYLIGDGLPTMPGTLG